MTASCDSRPAYAVGLNTCPSTALIIHKDVTKRTLGVEIAAERALVARPLHLHEVMAFVEAAFVGEAPRQLCARQRIEKSNHADRNVRLLDTVDHCLSHRDLLGIKPDDKAGGDEHAVTVNLMDALGDVAPGVLLLLHLHERLWIRALDADENPEEVRVLHRLQQLVVVRDVDRGFGGELERIVALF